MQVRSPRVAISNEVVGMATMIGMALTGQHDLAVLVAVMIMSRPRCPCILHATAPIAGQPRGLDR
jgi:hypothetical protein